MDVKTGSAKTVCFVEGEEGFTLIESVVAMALFTGVVLLLITVVSSFMLDEFPVRTRRAEELAQAEIAEMQEQQATSASSFDTLGFHIDRSVIYLSGVTEFQVTVRSLRDQNDRQVSLVAICQP